MVSFQGHYLPYLFFTVLREHWWVRFNLSIPKPLCQHSQSATHHLAPETCNWKAFDFSIKERLGVLHSQTSYYHTDFPGLPSQGPGVSWRGHKTMLSYAQWKMYLERPLLSWSTDTWNGADDREGGEATAQQSGSSEQSLQRHGSFWEEGAWQRTLILYLSTRSWKALD